jgi:hypothetical protein
MALRSGDGKLTLKLGHVAMIHYIEAMDKIMPNNG